MADCLLPSICAVKSPIMVSVGIPLMLSRSQSVSRKTSLMLPLLAHELVWQWLWRNVSESINTISMLLLYNKWYAQQVSRLPPRGHSTRFVWWNLVNSYRTQYSSQVQFLVHTPINHIRKLCSDLKPGLAQPGAANYHVCNVLKSSPSGSWDGLGFSQTACQRTTAFANEQSSNSLMTYIMFDLK